METILYNLRGMSDCEIELQDLHRKFSYINDEFVRTINALDTKIRDKINAQITTLKNELSVTIEGLLRDCRNLDKVIDNYAYSDRRIRYLVDNLPVSAQDWGVVIPGWLNTLITTAPR